MGCMAAAAAASAAEGAASRQNGPASREGGASREERERKVDSRARTEKVHIGVLRAVDLLPDLAVAANALLSGCAKKKKRQLGKGVSHQH